MVVAVQATHVHRVLGVCLLHATATSASFFESVKDKVINTAVGYNKHSLAVS